MVFSFSEAQVYYDSSAFTSIDEALVGSTHLGVGAHPDDLEVMAHHGILQCFESDQKKFFGITTTTGGGSHKGGPFTEMSNEEFIEQRMNEQKESAKLGKMAGCLLLGYESSDIKSQINDQLVEIYCQIIDQVKPEVIYTHNPFDKHKTHVGVSLHLVKALKKTEHKPKEFYGCEVWRGLDWVSDSKKHTLGVHNSEFVKSLIGCHHSQLVDKDYGEATLGRMKSNATFFDASKADEKPYQLFALDLMPLLGSISVLDFAKQFIDEFSKEIDSNFEGLV